MKMISEHENAVLTYFNSCNEILRLFCEKHEWDVDYCAWVGGIIGTITCINGFFIDTQDMISDLVDNADKDEFVRWYDFNTSNLFEGKTPHVSYNSWLRNR
jgi:hypothetical protein